VGEDGLVQEAENVGGVFWQVGTPDRRAEGRLELAGTDLPRLDVDRPIFDERSYSHNVTRTGETIAFSGDPHDLVADFQPRTIHGVLSDDSKVSAIDAQGAGEEGWTLISASGFDAVTSWLAHM
jgi:hypothetical protein